MHYGEIKNCDIANGIGVRVSLFVSGCTNHCEGCFQPETWDFNYGNDFTEETENRILEMLETEGTHCHCEVTEEMLSLIDVLVDGRFDKNKKNISLRFRGSENQRLIDLNLTRECGTLTLWNE